MIASAPSSAAKNSSPFLTSEPGLALAIRAQAEGPCLAVEPIAPSDLAIPISEAWRDACLRQGFPDTALADVPMRLVPILKDRSPTACTGYALELTLPDGTCRRREFTVHSLVHVATRTAQGLLDRGLLTQGQDYYYELVTRDANAAEDSPPQAEPCSVRVTTPALRYLDLPLRALLDRANAVEPIGTDVFPVFFTRTALDQAEACSRRGAKASPPVETGGVLVGALAHCRDSREFFVVVSEVLEVQEAVQEEFSLTYSSQSWLLIDRVMQARRKAHPQNAELLLGQCHGHNFLPNGGQTCDACPTRPVCDLSSVWASSHDKTWMNAVYARQPWALCQIFGLTARGEPVSKLYALSDGRWLPRGYHVLPEHPSTFAHE